MDRVFIHESSAVVRYCKLQKNSNGQVIYSYFIKVYIKFKKIIINYIYPDNLKNLTKLIITTLTVHLLLCVLRFLYCG
jgi:hypothetical protein